MKSLHLMPTDEMICPKHKVKVDAMTYNGELFDTVEFCLCCTADCTPFCRNCDQWTVADFNDYVKLSDDDE